MRLVIWGEFISSHFYPERHPSLGDKVPVEIFPCHLQLLISNFHLHFYSIALRCQIPLFPLLPNDFAVASCLGTPSFYHYTATRVSTPNISIPVAKGHVFSSCQCTVISQHRLAGQRLIRHHGNVHPMRAAGSVPIPIVKLPERQRLATCLSPDCLNLTQKSLFG